MKKINLSEEKIRDIINLYSVEKNSILNINKKLNIGIWLIKRVLKENNIKIRSNNEYKSKNVNREFFKEIDSEEKAYWLGFIAADGCVTNSKTLSISLSLKDIEHLELLKKSLNSEHKIIMRDINNGYKIGAKACMLSICDEYLFNDLNSHGILKNKSLILKFNTNLHYDLIRHYIRGYFDGDGSVYVSNNNLNISFTGTYDFLSKILYYFNDNGLNSNTKINKYKDKNIYDLKIGGTNKIKFIYDFLYKDSNFFLRRKKEVFDRFIK